MEIDTEIIKIGQKMAVLGPKGSFKKVRNPFQVSLFKETCPRIDFFDLVWPEMDSAGLKMWEWTQKASKSDQKWPFCGRNCNFNKICPILA